MQIYYRDINGDSLSIQKRPRAGAWIDITAASEAEVEKVSNWIKLDKADLIDILDDSEIPRIERTADSVIIFLRLPEASSKSSTQTFAIVVNSRILVTLSPKNNNIAKEILRVYPDVVTSQRIKLLGQILLQIAHLYTRQIKKLRTKIYLAGQKSEITDKDVAKLIEIEQVFNEYLAALSPMRTILNVLFNSRYLELYEEDRDLLEDISIDINQSAELCNVNLKAVRAIRDSYQIIISNRLNRQIKFLTGFTIIMTVPTIVASLFGMNVDLPFANEPWAFVLILAASGGLAAIFLLLFYWKRWL